MDDRLEKPLCLIGDRFIAHCKERPRSHYHKEDKIKRYSLRLISKAKCRITRETDFNKERALINRFERAFTVVMQKYAELSAPMGTLFCDFCSDDPKIMNKHTGQDHIPDFTLDRIDSHPLICSREDLITNTEYAEIISEQPYTPT